MVRIPTAPALAAAVAILLSWHSAWAQAPPSATLAVEGGAATSPAPAPAVADLIAEALERSPALAAARASVAARREMESPAGALPDPMIETSLQNVSFRPTLGKDENSMLGFEVRQGLLYPGKRAASRAVSAAETEGAAADLAALERQVAAEIATLYARIYALDRERESLAAATELVDLLEETAHSRYAAGEGDQEGILKIQVAAQRIAGDQGDLLLARQAAVAELNRWLDRPGGGSFGGVESLPEVPPIGADAEFLAVAGSAEVASAAARVRLAERRVEQARLDLKPNFSAGAGFASRGGLDPALIARFGVELPFWRRSKQLPLLRAAEQELLGARFELADAEAMARAEAARLRAAWTNALAQATRYREGILPQTSAALDAARVSYLNGRGDFSTVIEDFRLWLEARVALARREADRFVARAGFDRLAGIRPAPAGGKE